MGSWVTGMIICKFNISKKRNEKTIYSLESTEKTDFGGKTLRGKEQCGLL